MTVFVETPRLLLRSLEEADLPRLVAQIGEWEIIKWLAVVPYPYTLKNAEEFYALQAELYRQKLPECFIIASKADNLLMGGVGLRHETDPDNGVLGYWLGRAYWRQGFMQEAVTALTAHEFRRNPERQMITAVTDVANLVSQTVLRKAGFEYLGRRPRPHQKTRGSPEITCWRLDNGRPKPAFA